jgi:hypothetical protein
MQHEATCAELVEILGVTRKTVALWAQHGVMVKTSHGRYDLKASLRNWAEYQKIIREGYDNPLLTWQVRRDIEWSEAHPLPPLDPDNVELVDIDELATTPQPVKVEYDAAGRIARVIGEKSA